MIRPRRADGKFVTVSLCALCKFKRPECGAREILDYVTGRDLQEQTGNQVQYHNKNSVVMCRKFKRRIFNK